MFKCISFKTFFHIDIKSHELFFTTQFFYVILRQQ